MVRQGKVLYIGLSNYSPERTKKAAAILEDLGVHCLVHQPRFNMLDQEVKQNGLFQVLEEAGMGAAVYSPLAQGLLSGKYNNGVPKDSRAAGPSIYFTQDNLKPELLEKVRKLSAISERRGQTMPQLALSWILNHPVIASVIIGASRVSQIDDNIDALKNLSFSEEELREIDQILA